MLTEEQTLIIGDALAPLFDYLEQEVITDIVRRVAKTMEYTRTAELMAMDMRELGYSPTKIRAEVLKRLNADKEFQRILAENTLAYKKEVSEIIADIVAKAELAGDEIVANAGKMAWIDDLSVWESGGITLTDNGMLDTLVKAMQRQMDGWIVDLARSTGFKGLRGFESVETAYRTELNKAIFKLASGGFSQEKVIRDCVHTLAESGLRTIDYASGYSRQLTSAVQLAVRTGSHQLSGQIQKENINQSGVNLIYVQEHENARNKGTGVQNHEDWQGKVYYIEGSPDQYKDEAKRIGQDKIEDLWEKTGYSVDGAHENNPLGLYGYNCRHIMNPWWEGASVLPDKIPPTPTVNYKGKTLDGYEQTQEMRRQEWKIRNLKREKEALERTGQDASIVKAKIRAKTNEYKEFCSLCGVPPVTSRLRYESNTSDITKTEAWKAYQEMLKVEASND